jgi:formamidopyrimidine-DNA glycosylase
VPELPDLTILADALDTSLSGRHLIAAETPQSLVLRGTQSELLALAGQQLLQITRRGKFLTFTFERDRLIVNAMLTGRLGLAEVASRPFPQTAAVFRFAGRTSEAATATGRTQPLPNWPASADWLPASDAPVELRYRDSTRMGKLYLLPQGVERAVAGWAEQGPDADDPALTLDVWRARMGRHSGELKNLLRNQQFVAGIGNAYSDEILWAARLAPFRTRASLAGNEIDMLFGATREVLSWAVTELRARVPPRLEIEQRRFLRVHGKGGTACPRCGSTISEVSAGGSITNWCRTCQR